MSNPFLLTQMYETHRLADKGGSMNPYSQAVFIALLLAVFTSAVPMEIAAKVSLKIHQTHSLLLYPIHSSSTTTTTSYIGHLPPQSADYAKYSHASVPVIYAKTVVMSPYHLTPLSTFLLQFAAIFTIFTCCSCSACSN